MVVYVYVFALSGLLSEVAGAGSPERRRMTVSRRDGWLLSTVVGSGEDAVSMRRRPARSGGQAGVNAMIRCTMSPDTSNQGWQTW